MLVVIWALLVARIATFFVMQVALPTLLTLLALVFGEELRRAAATCLEEGRKAQRTLRAASRMVRAGGGLRGTDDEEPRDQGAANPSKASNPRTRVATEDFVDAEGVAVDPSAVDKGGADGVAADNAERYRARGG
jgi:hypothetical protein